MAKNRPPTAPYTYTETRTTISDQAIAQAAYNAGFRGDALVIAVATAIGESHGNTTAIADHHEFSVGLWQINVNGRLGSRLRRFGFTSWQDLYDPDKNAKAAYILSNGGKKFAPWSIYKHGAYLKYMDRATAAASSVNSQPPAVGGTTFVPVTDPSPNQLLAGPTSINSTGMLELAIGVMGIIIVVVLVKTRGNANG